MGRVRKKSVNRKIRFEQQTHEVRLASTKGGLIKSNLRGGDAMSIFEAFMLVFTAMTFVVALVKLIIALVDIFNKKK